MSEELALHTEMYNGSIEEGLLERAGYENLSPEYQAKLDYLRSLPRNRGITNDGRIIDLETGRVVDYE